MLIVSVRVFSTRGLTKQEKLVASGDIYKGIHSGWYSVSDECFYAATQVERVAIPGDGRGKMIASETGNDVSWEEETNWKFRLGKFKDGLREWLSRPEGEYYQLTEVGENRA